jgi:hypothetical protein
LVKNAKIVILTLTPDKKHAREKMAKRGNEDKNDYFMYQKHQRDILNMQLMSIKKASARIFCVTNFQSSVLAQQNEFRQLWSTSPTRLKNFHTLKMFGSTLFSNNYFY